MSLKERLVTAACGARTAIPVGKVWSQKARAELIHNMSNCAKVKRLNDLAFRGSY